MDPPDGRMKALDDGAEGVDRVAHAHDVAVVATTAPASLIPLASLKPVRGAVTSVVTVAMRQPSHEAASPCSYRLFLSFRARLDIGPRTREALLVNQRKGASWLPRT